MESRLLNSQSFEYMKEHWDKAQGNRSGCQPIGEHVLILVDIAVEKSSGGIIITSDLQEKRQFAAETGTIVAMGGGAFTWNTERSRPWVGEKPEVGHHVIFSRYAGRVIAGNDKRADGTARFYRLILDKEVGGIATDEGFSVTMREKVD